MRKHLITQALCVSVLLITGCATTPAPQTGLTAPPRMAPNSSGQPVEAKGINPVPSEHGLKVTPLLSSLPSKTAPTVSPIPQAALNPPPRDLWERIRRGFAIPDLEGPLVAQHETWYATRPEYVERMVDRSRRYLFHVVEELEARHMPTELALLPFIESAFNPQAMSSAKAAGMWQFIPSTGKHFDLQQNMFRDERRDVLASTDAALDYLQKLYNMFGDWQLALAAYNWGEGNVSRAINKNLKLGLPTTYSDLNMPAETQHYVPKLQAVKNIIAGPQLRGVDLPLIANHAYFQAVSIDRDIDVELAAQLAQVSLNDFKALNPSANKPLIIASGTPKILLPWDNAAIFQRNLASHKGALASWTAWRAPTTLKPSEAAQRVGMSEDEFRELNHIKGRVLIKAGSTLLVSRSEHRASDISETLAASAQLILAPEVVLQKKLVKAKKNDSLKAIAGRYGVTVAQIKSWNDDLSDKSKLKAGQRVALFLPKSVRPAGAAKYASNSKHDRTRVSAKVRKGGAVEDTKYAAKSTKATKGKSKLTKAKSETKSRIAANKKSERLTKR